MFTIKVIIGASIICFLGLFLTINIYGQQNNSDKVITSNVTTILPASEIIPQNVVTQPSTILPVQQIPVVTNSAPPVIQNQVPSTGNSVVDSLMGAALTLIPVGYALYKQRQNTTEITQGLNKSTQVQTQTVESIKGTDYTDEDIMRVFVATLDQLGKIEGANALLDEKLKTNPQDLLMNNKSVREAANNLLTQIISDNQAYYHDINTSSDDTCKNNYVRNLSMANKMTRRGF